MILASVVENGALYALVGAFTGFTSGALGIGGGMVVVPALLYIFHHTQVVTGSIEMHVAAGTSLAIMIFTAISSVMAHQRAKPIHMSIFKTLWPGLVVGTVIGALLADMMPTAWLKLLFGILLLVIAFKMLFNTEIDPSFKPRGRLVNFLVTLSIGTQSGLLGVGGGTFIVPYLSLSGLTAKKIPSISAMCTLVVALIGTAAFILTGANAPLLPDDCTGYVYWPAVVWISIPSILFAPIGAKMTYVLPVKQLKLGLIIILIIAAIDMLI